MHRSVPVRVVHVSAAEVVVEWCREEVAGAKTTSTVAINSVPMLLRMPNAAFWLLLENADVLISQGARGNEVVVGVTTEGPSQNWAEFPIDWYCQSCGAFSHHTDGISAHQSPDARPEHAAECPVGSSMSAIGCCSICHQDLGWGANLCVHHSGGNPLA